MTLRLPFIAAPIPAAAAAVGLSETSLKAAIRDGDLELHYFGTKPVIRAVDLDEWVESLPTSRPNSAA